MIDRGAYHSSGLRVFIASALALLASLVFSGVIGLIAALIGNQGVAGAAFALSFMFGLFTNAHLLIHRYRYVDPVEMIKHVFGIVAVISLIGAAVSGALGNDNGFGALVGVLVIPFLVALPVLMAMGDKPPPSEYGNV